MKGQSHFLWGSTRSTNLCVKMAIKVYFHSNMMFQHVNRIAELQSNNSPLNGNPISNSNHLRYIQLFFLAIITAGCSSQNISNNQPTQIHPLLGWILVGALVVAWLVLGFYILWQIYNGIIKRDLSYTLGGVLGFLAGFIIGIIIDRDGGTAIWLSIIGMNVGGIVLKKEIKANGFYAFIIGIIWLGIFIVYSAISISVIQEGITLNF